MGIVDGIKDKLGFEGSGVITKTAPGVENVRVGDRVFFCDMGCLTTKLVTSAKLCAKLPDELSFEDAATMPCVYSTVVHSLVNVGGLESGQSVLIHSACGGVGIAAIQLCRMLGAEVSILVLKLVAANVHRSTQRWGAKKKCNTSSTHSRSLATASSIREAHPSSAT